MIKMILIIWVTGLNGTSLQMQEFDDELTCEVARIEATRMITAGNKRLKSQNYYSKEVTRMPNIETMCVYK